MAIELYTIGVPFFFLLAIIYGALEMAGVFKHKGVKIILATAIAAISVTNSALVEGINFYLPYTAGFFIVVFFLRFIQKGFKSEKHDWTLIAIAAGLALLIFVQQGEAFRTLLDRGPLGYDNMIILIAIVFIQIGRA